MMEERLRSIRAIVPPELSLANYLRALGSLLQKESHRSDFPTEVFLGLLQEALTADPVDVAPPGEHPRETHSCEDVLALIAAQVADLDAMEKSGLSAGDEAYFGVTAPSGRRWYNFDVDGYLDCAGAGISANGSAEPDAIGWEWIGSFLTLGRIYE